MIHMIHSYIIFFIFIHIYRYITVECSRYLCVYVYFYIYYIIYLLLNLRTYLPVILNCYCNFHVPVKEIWNSRYQTLGASNVCALENRMQWDKVKNHKRKTFLVIRNYLKTLWRKKLNRNNRWFSVKFHRVFFKENTLYCVMEYQKERSVTKFKIENAVCHIFLYYCFRSYITIKLVRNHSFQF